MGLPADYWQSLIAQGSEYPLKKPAAFHWDFFLLGCTTLIAGIFGVPAPNGATQLYISAWIRVANLLNRTYSPSTFAYRVARHLGVRE